MSTSSWNFVSAIPGIAAPSSFEADGIAFIGPPDSRYEDVLNLDPLLNKYLNSFFTPFSAVLKPAIIVMRADQGRIDSESLVRFRNILAVSAVLECWIKGFDRQFSDGAVFSDLFDIYPIHPTRDCDGLVAHTPFEYGLIEIDGFRGQPTPVTANNDKINVAFDTYLLDALRDLFINARQTKKHCPLAERVFRSIEIVYHATKAPFNHLGSDTEQGTVFSLWVSAFEILAHPGHRNVCFSDVSRIIRSVPWSSGLLCANRYRPIDSNRSRAKKRPNTTLPVQIYGRLLKTRNHYFHGSPLRPGAIEPAKRKAWGDLRFQIPALYRSVLLSILSANGFGHFPSARRNRRAPTTDTEISRLAEESVACFIQEKYEQPLLPARCRMQ